MIQNIIVQDFQKNKVDLMNTYKGKPMLVIIYNNACLGCTGRAIPLAYDFQEANPELQVVGIHSNFGIEEVSEADIKAIFTSGEIPFPIYIDENHKVYDQFKSEGTPQWLLFTKEAELYRSIFGSQEGAQNRLAYAIGELMP